MMHLHFHRQSLIWVATAVVIAAVLITGLLTNATLRSVEKNLPNTLFKELYDLDRIIDDFADAVVAVTLAARSRTPADIAEARNRLEIVFNSVAQLRNTYVIDNRINASAFHAAVAPAIADLRVWLHEGVSGYGPDSQITMAVVQARITGAFHEARALNQASQARAREMLTQQRQRLDRFLLSANLFFGFTLAITLLIVVLLVRQHLLEQKEARTRSDLTSARQSLQQSENRFRVSFENAPAGMAILDPDGCFSEVNAQLCAMLGYRADEMIGRSADAFTHPEDRPAAQQRWAQLLKGQIACDQAEKRYLHQNGSVLWTIASNALIHDNDDQPLYIVSQLVDITDRKTAQAEKQRLEAQLHQALKMEAIGTLAGGIAHDFNNLLMGIQGRASLMNLDLEPGHPHIAHIQAIEAQVRSAAELTGQLLGFARGGKFEVKSVDLSDLVKTSAEMFGRTHKEIRIHTDLHRPLWSVEADRKQIEQVLLNLYLNAWQAMPQGGSLYLATANITLEEAYCQPHQIPPGRYVKVSVTDTGQGMDAAVRQRIFEPFFTTRGKSRGTGLGLASSYGIVKNHGGTITVYSEKALGTTFSIYLPSSDKPAQPERAPQMRLEQGSETILLVDDEEMILDVGRSILERLGYTVLVAASGQKALDIVAQSDKCIDLVVLDMIMPEMDGGTTFDRIRQLRPHLRVLLSSGYSINGQADRIIQRGCNGFIQKPFNIAQLSEKIRAVLDHGPQPAQSV